MKTAYFFIPIALLSALFCLSTATFNEERIDELSQIVGNSGLLNDPNTREQFLEAIQIIRSRYPNCRPNVCFGLDGSGSISNEDYNFQKAFVVLAVATLGGLNGSKFAAVEYGAIVDPIVELQTPTAQTLLTINADQSQSASLTLVGPAIQWCSTQMELTPAPVNKIVILGDGRTSVLDNNSDFGAQALAQKFASASVANAVCGGLVGGGNKDFFLELVGGAEERVLESDQWSNIINIITAFVEQICG